MHVAAHEQLGQAAGRLLCLQLQLLLVAAAAHPLVSAAVAAAAARAGGPVGSNNITQLLPIMR